MPHRPTHRLTREEKKRKKEQELERGKALNPPPTKIVRDKKTGKIIPQLDPMSGERVETKTIEREQIPFFRTPEGELRAGGAAAEAQAAREREFKRLGEEQEELEARQEEALPVLEEAGVFEGLPETVELDVTEAEREATKHLARRTVFGHPILEAGKIIFGEQVEDFRIDDLIQNPETAREIMLQEIQREELDRAKTSSQKLGALLEPFVGDLQIFSVDIGAYANSLLRMPKQEVDTIIEEFAELDSSVSGLTDPASQGELGAPLELLEEVGVIEEQVFRLEARLKRTILESVELKANPETVNLFEVKIKKLKTGLFEAKLRAAEGAVVTPSDAHLFLTLEEIRERVNRKKS